MIDQNEYERIQTVIAITSSTKTMLVIACSVR
jgi:hypothetical protein